MCFCKICGIRRGIFVYSFHSACDIIKKKCRNGENDMAKKIGLSIYGLSIVNGDKRLELHNIINNKGLIEIVHDFALKNEKKLSNDPGKESIFYFDQITKEEIYAEDSKKEYTILYGRVKTGEYGIESELLDVNDGSVYERSTSQADLLPLAFA